MSKNVIRKSQQSATRKKKTSKKTNGIATLGTWLKNMIGWAPAPKRGASMQGNIEQDLIRFKLVWVLMAIGMFTLIGQAFWIQVINKDFYLQEAEKNRLLHINTETPSYRGKILDRNGQALAVSAPVVSVIFDPKRYAKMYYSLKKEEMLEKDNPKKLQKIQLKLENMKLNRLAALSGVSIDELNRLVKINNNINFLDKNAVKAALPKGPGSGSFVLMDKVTPEKAQPVIDLNFFAVSSKTFNQRYYPQPLPNAHLLGFMAESDKDKTYKGRAGIEAQYESVLAGQSGLEMFIKDSSGKDVLKEVKQIRAEVPSKDVQLTIDSRLQYLLYKELEQVGHVQKARWATGLIVDVNTGEVLALSNWPSYNPNNLNTQNRINERNHALIDILEPGSVMKPFTVATALSSGKYNVNTVINTNPGTLTLGNYTIRDSGNLGLINMRKLLQRSSNVGSAKIALSLPPSTVSHMQKAFGFGQVTNLKFPGEASGKVPTPAMKERARRATVAYGYGLDVTVAQIAQAYAVLGAGGVLHPLTIVKSIKNSAINQSDDDVSNITQNQPPKAIQVIKRQDALAIVEMLHSVTEPGGTATLAAIDGYKVAGKTGTARRTNPKGGYFTDQYRTVFAGIAPASNPRFSIVIVVEDPRKEKYGGLVAAPVFANVMKETLRLYNVPYDKALANEETKPKKKAKR